MKDENILREKTQKIAFLIIEDLNELKMKSNNKFNKKINYQFNVILVTYR